MVYRWSFFLSLLGIIFSGYSLYAHYSSTPSGLCNWSETFSCDVVNKSQYAEIYGVPVALLGVGGYVLLALLSWLCAGGRNFRKDLTVFGFLGLLFSLYLTYVEAFVLVTWCPVCLLSQAMILAITVLSVVGLVRRR